MVHQDHISSERIRVLIAHEVRVVRDGIASLLSQSPMLTVVDFPPQENGHEEQQDGNAVDVALIVAELANNGAADQIQKIKNTHADAKVVIIGVSGTENESLEYIEAGASGYVLPGSRPEDLIETIQKVHRGEASCPPDILARLFERVASFRSRLQIAQDSELSNLTNRELEILHLVADGMSNKEIATYLKLEIQTVKNHVHNILEKLRVHNRREAAACTRRYGLAVKSK
jgi:two-component system nitrate/nitrite response regulator NarL